MPAKTSVTAALSPSALADKSRRLTRAPRNAEVTATKSLAGALDTARRKPVTVIRNGSGKPAAVVLSARRYRELVQLINAANALVEKAEERLWLAAALEAEKEGVVPREESEAFLRELREKYGG